MLLSENPHAVFSPLSLVVIGGREQEQGMGDIILANLVKAGYEGKIFPVNLKADNILGLPILRKPEEIPEADRPLDLAVICLPLEECAAALRECAAVPVRAAILMGPCVREKRAAQMGIEKELRGIAEEANIILLGPNSLGLVSTAAGLNLSPDGSPTPAGHTALFSQSGPFGLALFARAKEQLLGISSFITLGDKTLVDECDILSCLAEDPQTRVIAGYLESVENGPRFLRKACHAAGKKPVILFKPGRTPEGARAAASSRSGILAGSDIAFDAAFKKSGIIRVDRMQDLIALARAFSTQPLPRGPGVAFITNASGPGIIAADLCAGSGLALSRFSPDTLYGLKTELPTHAGMYNPIDVTGEASPRRLAFALGTALADASVHAAIVLVCPVPCICPETLAREIIGAPNPHGKSLLVCLMGGEEFSAARRILTTASIPCYDFPEEAVTSLGAMYRRSQWKEHPLPVEIGYRHDKGRARRAIDEARARGIFELNDYYSQQILNAYEIPCLEAKLARTSDEAVQIAKQIGGRVALKLVSPHVSHRTDVRGVALNLTDKQQIRAAFLDITARAKHLHKEAYIAGCMVQAMAREHSRETIIGFKRDSVFGPVVFFSLAGVHMQPFRDVSGRLAPISLDDAHDMVRELRAFPVLAGLQGQRTVKFTALEDILLIMSRLALDFPDIQEVECNPVFADEQGAQVGDMRVTLVRPRPALRQAQDRPPETEA